LGASWTAADSHYRFRVQATLTESWNERDESAGPLFKPSGYAVFDFYYTQAIGERTTLRAGLLNLADRTYWNWSDIRGLSPDDPVIPYLAQSGRSVSLSLNMHW
ncbi:MAG: TonB-dependent receptor, partial [Gammaproteobacteria bacterium]|nr:TonB-dependent receptor [Gammaproteobacteria bacterium]